MKKKRQRFSLPVRRLSELARVGIGAKPKECWRNAFMALVLPELKGARYVEGYVVLQQHNLVLEHGWLDLRGQIVDPTLPTQPRASFPAVTLTHEEVCDALARYRKARYRIRWPPVSNWNALHQFNRNKVVVCVNPEWCALYERARKQAERFAYGRISRRLRKPGRCPSGHLIEEGAATRHARQRHLRKGERR